MKGLIKIDFIRIMPKRQKKQGERESSSMRGVEICPSRFAHRDTTDALGITEDIEALFEKIGLGYIFDLHCDCYADLTRQFLASARLYHPDEDNPVADKAMFSFIVNRQFHSMTIFQLCDVFGFGKGRQSCVPDFPEHNDFWTFIASGNFISREAKQARIRSPCPDKTNGEGISRPEGNNDPPFPPLSAAQFF
ncbi:hypothetical protein HID58_092975 [Brassica napus]|uniref:Arabidopsis retrotransposon Orf1 C-terminal domain-containing protein n=1 Tax=Brassica napus TaxID=3708 RepID=A0ABQ7XE68_BRANA|nr:hypothetical protein HID58_092975 [Brassica napus]